VLDSDSLEACYRRLERPLYNVLFRWLWDAQACQDVMHDSFLRLWDRRASLEPDALDALVYTTALNLARNRLRWQKLRQWVAFDDETTSPGGSDDGEQAAEQQLLRRALDKLPDNDRQLLLLSEFSGFDTAEIAGLLGIAAGTVGSRRHRAVARLRQLMGVAHA
jgi:RNA polymerase sigma factor (sigma-70 family)